eukprot:scaffold1017_cov374-Prasinococcus_capsulatus_cf.AAC.14
MGLLGVSSGSAWGAGAGTICDLLYVCVYLLSLLQRCARARSCGAAQSAPRRQAQPAAGTADGARAPSPSAPPSAAALAALAREGHAQRGRPVGWLADCEAGGRVPGAAPAVNLL